jgi:hypothetical protein
MTDVDQMLSKLESLHSDALRVWHIFLSDKSYLKIIVYKYPNQYIISWDDEVKTFTDPFELLEYLSKHVKGAEMALAEVK